MLEDVPSAEALRTKISDWRERLLDIGLSASTTLHLGGAAIYAAVTQHWQGQGPMLTLAVLVGCAHWAAARLRRRVRLRSVAFIASLYLELVLFGLHFAWSPTVLLVALYGTLYGGLLLGPIGALAIPLGLLPLLVAGGVAVMSGWAPRYGFSSLDEPRNWLRNAVLVTGLASIMAISMRRVLGLLMDAEEQARKALEATKVETVQLQSARSTRIATETTLRDAQKLQTVAQLSGGIAHFFNNTLTVVRDAADQLRQRPERQVVVQIARDVEASVLQTAATTRHLLAFSRRDNPIAGPTLLHEELRELEPAIKEALPENITLAMTLGPTPAVLTESTRLRQVVLNLVLNARDAISNGGVIRIETGTVAQVPLGDAPTDLPTNPSSSAVLVVSDDGEGMKESVVARACDPFFTTKDPSRHGGLGLFVAYGLVKQWGGSLKVTSEEGQGTRVVIVVPEITQQTSQVAASRAEYPNSESHLLADAGRFAARQPSVSGTESDPLEIPSTSMRNPGVEAWKEQSLGRALHLSAAVSAITCIGDWLLSSVPDLLSMVAASTALLITFAAARLRQLAFEVRLAALLIVILSVSTQVVLHNGFMSPIAVAGLAITPLLAAVYAGNLAIGVTLLCVAGVFVLGATGPVAGGWNSGNVDPNIARNWFRIALVFPVAFVIAARLVLDVLATAMQAVARVEGSIDKLLHMRAERLSETRSLSQARVVVERTTQLEAAGRVAGTIAHDLNNALFGILGWATILLESRQTDRDEVLAAAKVFDDCAEFAENLILQLNIDASNAQRFGLRACDIAKATERFIRTLKPMLQERIRLVTELAPDCFAPVTENELRRILLNLTANSRDAMPNGGLLTLRCGRKESLQQGTCAVYLAVADTGIGMSDQVRTHLFDAFFTTKPADQGTGLGLHAVSELVHVSGGEIAVETQPNEGTTFTLIWPQSSPPQSLLVEPAARQDESRGHVLLAEDNDLVRRAMVRGLERAGYTVTAASDGTEAMLRCAETQDFAALCTDAIMPGEPSANLIRTFRSKFPDRAVIVCSGYLPKELHDVEALGGIYFLAKPFSSSTLVEVVRRETRRMAHTHGDGSTGQ